MKIYITKCAPNPVSTFRGEHQLIYRMATDLKNSRENVINGKIMNLTKVLLLTLSVVIVGCAQVPRESVELSATVGRDLAEMRKSHTALIDIYYGKLMSNVNQFIDNVYLPYQIQKTLSDDAIKQEMLSAIESASRIDVTGERQKDAFQKIQFFHLIIHEEVEAYRKIKLKPVKDQYKSVLAGVNNTYEKIHYANSIVTGHLASVLKVHDAQNEILEKLDLKDIRVEVGKEMSEASDKISELLLDAKDGESKLAEIVSKFEDLTNNDH